MSESNSDTSQSTSQTDNRRVIGQGGVSAEGGSNVSITNQTLDANAINAAFGFGRGALDFGRDTVAAALGFGGKAIDAALNAQSDALAFAESNARLNTQASYNFAADALGEAFSLGSASLGKAFNAMDNATTLVKDAYADAKGRGALTDKILMGAIAALAVVALMAVKK